jgi:hypothetical protein
VKPKIMTRTQVKEVSYTPIDIEKKLNEALQELQKQDENTKVINIQLYKEIDLTYALIIYETPM